MKNVVFDFGQVLVHFEPSYMVGRYVSDTKDAQLLEAVVFDRLYWDRLDAGTIDDDELFAAFEARLPARLWQAARQIYDNWFYNIPEIEGMRELILYVKNELGASVFLLSNISRHFAAHADEIPILRLIDKCIFSAVCGMVKPHAEIYAHLCESCGIAPEETVFIDDRAENVEGARQAGITGYLFEGDVARLRDYLTALLQERG